MRRLLYGLLVIPLISGCGGCDGGSIDPETVERVEIPLDQVTNGTTSTRRNFYFIIDGSGSMRDRPSVQGSRKFSSKIEGAKWAVAEFLRQVPADCNLGLYIFDGNGRGEVVPLGSNNREEFLSAVERIDAGGGTPLSESIHDGVDKLVAQYKQQLGYGEFRLVVVTDGLAWYLPEAAGYALKYGVPIYTIGLCVDAEHPLRQYSVSYKDASSIEELAQGLKEVLAELEDFTPTEFEEN